ncbi:MAG: low-complexity tail membrane protein [Cyanobium sp.]
MNPRTEPLLWIQLLGLAVLPLEALLLLLVLGGSDPGPVPLVEEMLCWSLGAVASALLLWRTPADVWSVLLAQVPARGRRDLQQRLSRLQTTLPLKLLGPGLGAVALLPLLIRMDQLSAIAAPLWHLSHVPRLVALLLAALLLTVMLWQWQQVVQALWLLTRSPSVVGATTAMDLKEREESRLSLGIPILLPSPLLFETPESDSVESSGINGSPLSVEPEQPPADEEGTHLDEPIA